MKPPFPVLNSTQSLALGILRGQRSGATAPAPLGPDCVDPGDAQFCVRRHQQTPVRDGVPPSLPHLQPVRESLPPSGQLRARPGKDPPGQPPHLGCRGGPAEGAVLCPEPVRRARRRNPSGRP